MLNFFSGKRILITGVCGTVGAELIRQLSGGDNYNVKEIVGLDNNETALFFLDQAYIDDLRVNLFLCDIRNKQNLIKKMEGIDLVFHCAAFKHVIMCERSPEEAIMTNIVGLQNVIEAARINSVSKVIFTSSDKAVNPTSVMGTSKLMGERLITAANSIKNKSSTIYASTRFGNVLGSNGSVVPIFKKQIEAGGPVTLTNKKMTRFVMSIEAAVDLVIRSSAIALGGEVFITKMPIVRIEDLAKAMIYELHNGSSDYKKTIDFVEIGIKPGEKLYEELMSGEETRRSLELQDFFVVLPAFRGIYQDINYKYDTFKSDTIFTPYISNEQDALKLHQVRRLLHNFKLIETGSNIKRSRYWPGDKEENQS